MLTKTLIRDCVKVDRSSGEKVEVGRAVAGSSVKIVISDDAPWKMTISNDSGFSCTCKSIHWNYYFKQNGKPPSYTSLEKWVFDGIAKSLNGKKVEPDGWDCDGTPSWLLALGMI